MSPSESPTWSSTALSQCLLASLGMFASPPSPLAPFTCCWPLLDLATAMTSIHGISFIHISRQRGGVSISLLQALFYNLKSGYPYGQTHPENAQYAPNITAVEMEARIADVSFSGLNRLAAVITPFKLALVVLAA